ncbi:sugar transferase [Paracraurococcus lichenis]|uniref:Sugar transferase n=1 Tax=Paracraurococcus lichenis TaxID=3064888 RepID=A0ABT9DSG1_9PROT|nr:sugar transferase [Paracraurococcus sp. LOR1-02]MDO9706821.1 sugar transferase [Paracraurococcus sp. LOR1-02]
MLGVEVYRTMTPEVAIPALAAPGSALPRHGRAPVRTAAPQPALKRAMDILGAALLLLVTAPLFALLALLIRADGGPVLYAHERVGRGGRRFGCLKFRSMVVDSQARLAALLAADPEARAEWEATRKLKDDPRVTRIGRFLRATSLDELPQVLNVLRGEMSLVGPRPVVAAELEEHYGKAAEHYLSVRPGITGLWQISGRSDTTYATRVALDIDYASNPSLLADLRILLRTPLAVLSRRGAY